MPPMNLDEPALKRALKEALAETLLEHRDVFAEVLEDFALAEGIREGRETKAATRDEVFRILRGMAQAAHTQAAITVNGSPSLLDDATRILEQRAERVITQQRFNVLAPAWKSETKYYSNVAAKIAHPNYYKIIGMGEPAVPLILNDLVENGPNDWFWALTAITDHNPITKEIAGNMAAMREAWIQWGLKAGYLKDYPKKTSDSSRT